MPNLTFRIEKMPYGNFVVRLHEGERFVGAAYRNAFYTYTPDVVLKVIFLGDTACYGACTDALRDAGLLS